MYIVFIAAETTNSADKQTYADIMAEITKTKNTVHDGTFPSDTAKHDDHAASLTREIKKADGIVVEATLATFNLGRLITLAALQHKPVIMVQNSTKTAHLLTTGSNRMVNVKPYATMTDIADILHTFFRIAKKQRLTYRFNLMLSRDINSYVAEKAKRNAVSKADYIRDLVIRDMEENA